MCVRECGQLLSTFLGNNSIKLSPAKDPLPSDHLPRVTVQCQLVLKWVQGLNKTCSLKHSIKSYLPLFSLPLYLHLTV